MQRNELIRCGENIFRVLETKEDKALIINCVQKSMPKWANCSDFTGYEPCTEESLHQMMNRLLPDMGALPSTDRRIAHERYTLIAGILPFIGDDKHRCEVIARIADDRNVSKQTIRNYLHLYLVYQSVAALAPCHKSKDRALTQDEKNMHWALNKFFYTRRKNSIPTAYTLMLKERYCDAAGILLPEYPSLHQFKYFYRKHRKMETFYISRDGLKNYQRNHRPLLGDGVQEYAPAVGVGMLDATICDIYLVNDAGNLVGRPILTTCVDAYSGLCCGYSLSWEGGVYSIRNLLANVIADKVQHTKQFGISIQKEDWPCSELPATLVTNMGAEYKSDTFEQIAELGVTVVNLPSYRPELKGVVEKFFDLVQGLYKKHLKGRGVIEPDFQERGVHDYRRDACLTMAAFEKVIIHCIIYYNSRRVIEDFPFTNEMLAQKVAPVSSQIWNWGISKTGANLIAVDYETLMLTLLPRTTGRFSRRGLIVNRLRYKHDEYTERFLQGGTTTVAYNPDDSSAVWLIERGEFIRFELIESLFMGRELAAIHSFKEEQRALELSFTESNIQPQIDFASHIDAIANAARHHNDTNIRGIRQTRRTEKSRMHIGFLKGGTNDKHDS